MAVDEWLHREHGVMSSHHGLGLLLALLDQFGYVVTPPNGSRPELDHAALVDLLRQAMAAGASFFIEESVAGRVRRDVLMMEVFDDFAESFTQIRRSLVEALLNPEEAQDA